MSTIQFYNNPLKEIEANSIQLGYRKLTNTHHENNDLEEKIHHQELRNIGVEGKKEVM